MAGNVGVFCAWLLMYVRYKIIVDIILDGQQSAASFVLYLVLN